MPSPVLMAALVVKGKMRPPPPVQMITALAGIACMAPERTLIAVTPQAAPLSSSSSRVPYHSS